MPAPKSGLMATLACSFSSTMHCIIQDRPLRLQEVRECPRRASHPTAVPFMPPRAAPSLQSQFPAYLQVDSLPPAVRYSHLYKGRAVDPSLRAPERIPPCQKRPHRDLFLTPAFRLRRGMKLCAVQRPKLFRSSRNLRTALRPSESSVRASLAQPSLHIMQLYLPDQGAVHEHYRGGADAGGQRSFCRGALRRGFRWLHERCCEKREGGCGGDFEAGRLRGGLKQ